jgi:hypothetical protein
MKSATYPILFFLSLFSHALSAEEKICFQAFKYLEDNLEVEKLKLSCPETKVGSYNYHSKSTSSETGRNAYTSFPLYSSIDYHEDGMKNTVYREKLKAYPIHNNLIFNLHSKMNVCGSQPSNKKLEVDIGPAVFMPKSIIPSGLIIHKLPPVLSEMGDLKEEEENFYSFANEELSDEEYLKKAPKLKEKFLEEVAKKVTSDEVCLKQICANSDSKLQTKCENEYKNSSKKYNLLKTKLKLGFRLQKSIQADAVQAQPKPSQEPQSGSVDTDSDRLSDDNEP